MYLLAALMTLSLIYHGDIKCGRLCYLTITYKDDKQWFNGEYSTKQKNHSWIGLLHFLRVFSYAQYVVLCKDEDF